LAAFFGGRIFFGGYSAAGQNLADPDIRRQLGTLLLLESEPS